MTSKRYISVVMLIVFLASMLIGAPTLGQGIILEEAFDDPDLPGRGLRMEPLSPRECGTSSPALMLPTPRIGAICCSRCGSYHCNRKPGHRLQLELCRRLPAYPRACQLNLAGRARRHIGRDCQRGHYYPTWITATSLGHAAGNNLEFHWGPCHNAFR